MSSANKSYPLTGVLGLFAFALWSVYAMYATFQYPEVLPSVLIGAVSGLVACLAMAFNVLYWRHTVLLASLAYLLIYVIQVVRMTAIRPDLPFISALVFYYQTSWRVAIGAFEERGFAGGLFNIYLEFAMPILVIVLLVAIVIATRAARHASRST